MCETLLIRLSDWNFDLKELKFIELIDNYSHSLLNKMSAFSNEHPHQSLALEQVKEQGTDRNDEQNNAVTASLYESGRGLSQGSSRQSSMTNFLQLKQPPLNPIENKSFLITETFIEQTIEGSKN